MEKLSFKEKVGFALGDGAANIAWRGVSTFLLVFIPMYSGSILPQSEYFCSLPGSATV
jgi:Na+/melibiose symporter-like transporter